MFVSLLVGVCMSLCSFLQMSQICVRVTFLVFYVFESLRKVFNVQFLCCFSCILIRDIVCCCFLVSTLAPVVWAILIYRQTDNPRL